MISQRDTQGGRRDTSRARSSAKPQSISELAETPFEQFDSNEEIGRPFHQSISDDADICPFNRYIELTTRLVSVILETHAWMSSRPRFERDNQLVRLTDDIKRIQDVEEQQGMSSSSHRPSGSRSRPISDGLVLLLVSNFTNLSCSCGAREARAIRAPFHDRDPSFSPRVHAPAP